uniref:Putative LOC755078 [Strongylocentrotus purpuratus] n=1 Tax=Lepeophtheirus salmonis TaxID=72036 RepID=A0A0K2U4P2_LEPSM
MLIGHGYPLPSNRTLQRNLKHIDFQPGILHIVMRLLQLKTQPMEDSNEYSGIVMNKMSIKSTFEYDVGGQLVRGYETLQPSSDEWVTHALVFALVGVKTHWKQVVTYHFTGSSFNQKDIALALKEIAIAAHKSGLIVTHITSDMGPCNQGVRNKIMNKIPNPITSLKDLFIFADVPHLLKNLRNHLTNDQDITSLRINSPHLRYHYSCSKI